MSNLAKKTRKRVLIIVLAVAILGSYFFFMSSSMPDLIPDYSDPSQPYSDPSQPPWNPIDDVKDALKPEGSATVYQALRVIYKDGSDKWVYPTSKATSLTVIEAGTTKIVRDIETYVYINVNFNKDLASWSFKADGNCKITHGGSSIPLVVDRDYGTFKIAQQGVNLPKNQDYRLASTVMSAYDFENSFDYVIGRTYVFTASLRNIEITLTFTDGTAKTMNIIGGASNDLLYNFRVMP